MNKDLYEVIDIPGGYWLTAINNRQADNVNSDRLSITAFNGKYNFNIPITVIDDHYYGSINYNRIVNKTVSGNIETVWRPGFY